MRTCARDTRGFTLAELMVVVVIIGILAAIATVGYRKYIARARTSEASAMLAEFSAKEQLYFLDNGQYSEAHTDPNAVYPSDNENADQFFPRDPGVTEGFDSARSPKEATALPVTWRGLGIRPRWSSLYCTYLANAGPAGSDPPETIGSTLWSATPAIPWFYVIAACNLAGIAGWPNTGVGYNYVTTMVLTHDSPAIRTTDEDR